MRSIIVDAGPLIALFDVRDSYHGIVKLRLQQLPCKLITTWPVITEVMYFLNASVTAQTKLIEWIEAGGLVVSSMVEFNIRQVKELINKYADVPMDFADATIILLAEESGVREILTIDSDFAIYKIKGKKYFSFVEL